jgi:hypothetical protein
MSDCSECETGECREDDYGTFDDTKEYGTVESDPKYCEDSFTSYYSFIHTVNPTDPYNKIDNYKPVFLNMYFDSVPENPLPDRCDADSSENYKPWSHGAKFEVQHNDEYDDTDYKFENPTPKDDDEASDVINIALALASAAASHPVAKVGVVAAAAWIDTSGWGSSVRHEEENLADNKTRHYWRISVKGADYPECFPQSPCDTNTARIDINPTGDTTPIKVDTASAYTFGVWEINDKCCTCACNESSEIDWFIHATSWENKTVEFDVE